MAQDGSGRRVLIVGCGYLGRRLARAEAAAGAAVEALVRSGDSARELAAAGITARAVDLDQVPLALDLATPDCLYYLVPPPAEGREDPRIGRFLQALGDLRPGRFVLVSTSGVYGDCGGDWVEESRPPAPREPRAWRRLDAERRCRRWCEQGGVDCAVLRVAGIYGPGRLPAARLRRAEPVLRAADAPWSNRIFIDDLVSACLAAGRDGAAVGVFNVADGRPGSMTDYFNRVADHLGLPRPPQIDRAEAERSLSPGMLGYLRESRRLSIGRLRRELGVEPQYPGLDLGLAACGRDSGPD